MRKQSLTGRATFDGEGVCTQRKLSLPKEIHKQTVSNRENPAGSAGFVLELEWVT